MDMSHGGHTGWTKYVDTVNLISHVCLGTLMDGLFEEFLTGVRLKDYCTGFRENGYLSW